MTGKGQTVGDAWDDVWRIHPFPRPHCAGACVSWKIRSDDSDLVLRDYVRSKFRFTASFSTVFANS